MQLLLIGFALLVIVDIRILFRRSVRIHAKRQHSRLLSLGNVNKIVLQVTNESDLELSLELIDEQPFQLQYRDFNIKLKLRHQEHQELEYDLRPTVRGEYNFGDLKAFLSSRIRLISKLQTIQLTENVPVYPSIIDMKKYELKALSQISRSYGIKRIRKIGHSHEFEQIKEYISGDNYQHINWRATGRYNKLMVNHFQEEQSQQVHAIIDKSRYMRLPFDDLSLLDHSINSSLVILNTAHNKQDKPGLITFAKKVDTVVRAERGSQQMRKILEALFKEKETKDEADYERLYDVIKSTLTGRGLLILYSNFESIYALRRVLPVLRKLNMLHLLVVVVFENAELIHYYKKTSKTLKEIYNRTVAHKFANEKKLIVQELGHYGIQTIHTKPEDLSIKSINKYLELKSRGLI